MNAKTLKATTPPAAKIVPRQHLAINPRLIQTISGLILTDLLSVCKADVRDRQLLAEAV